MGKITATAKCFSIACSVLAGAAAFFFLMKGLLFMRLEGQISELTEYAVLVTDAAVSLIAGLWIGRLVHFCLWECITGWLGNLWLHLEIKSQPVGEANPNDTVEQAE